MFVRRTDELHENASPAIHHEILLHILILQVSFERFENLRDELKRRKRFFVDWWKKIAESVLT